VSALAVLPSHTESRKLARERERERESERERERESVFGRVKASERKNEQIRYGEWREENGERG
jgi:hypothetical protein